MRHVMLILLAVVSLAAQESTLPPDHYCKNQPPSKSEPRAHECHCKYVCTVDPDGTVHETESADCKVYCHRERCTCHPEDPCPSPRHL